MGTEAQLDTYLEKARSRSEKMASREVRKRVEVALDELKVPWRKYEDMWQLESDVGEVTAGLDDDETVLSIWIYLGELTQQPKKAGEFLFTLLSINADASGGCYAIRQSEDTSLQPLLMAVARISAEKLDTEEVALALQSVFWLSSHFND